MKYEPSAEMLAREIFAHHKAKTISTTPMHVIQWSNPDGLGINAIKYLLFGRHFIVISEIGHAIFDLSSNPKCLRDVARLDYQQLSKACVSSRVGVGYPCWDAQGAEETLRDKIALRAAEAVLAERGYEEDDLSLACIEERMLIEFMAANDDVLEEDDINDVLAVSYEPDPACTIFLVGLNLALGT